MKKLFLAALFLLMTTSAALGQGGSNFLQSYTVASTAGCTAAAGLNTNSTIYPCGGQGGMFQNSLVTTHTLSWTVTATVSSCTIELEKSTDGVTWVLMTGTAQQTCTSSGTYTVTAAPFAYVRFNLNALTTNASGLIQVNYSGSAPVTNTVSCAFTGSATTAAIQTVAQTSACQGLVNGAYVYPVSVPAPTSLCPPTVYRVTADNTLSIYFTVLTAGACTPASGTYIMGVAR